MLSFLIMWKCCQFCECAYCVREKEPVQIWIRQRISYCVSWMEETKRERERERQREGGGREGGVCVCLSDKWGYLALIKWVLWSLPTDVSIHNYNDIRKNPTSLMLLFPYKNVLIHLHTKRKSYMFNSTILDPYTHTRFISEGQGMLLPPPLTNLLSIYT